MYYFSRLLSLCVYLLPGTPGRRVWEQWLSQFLQVHLSQMPATKVNPFQGPGEQWGLAGKRCLCAWDTSPVPLGQEREAELLGSIYPLGDACAMVGFLLWTWEGTQMIGPFPLDLLPPSLFLVFLPFPLSLPGHSSCPPVTSLSWGSSSRGKKGGGKWNGGWSRYHYSGAPSRTMDIYPEWETGETS